jgi:hypothetical protein
MSEPITWDIFRGEAPRYSPRLLPHGFAQQAYRCKLYDGKLKPFYKMKAAGTLVKTGEIQSIYPMRSAGTIFWLHWIEVVDAVRARVAGDTSQRIAFTGYGAPKATNFALATGGSPYPSDWWRLGVPAPISACSNASGGGGTGVARDRAYVVTFIHTWADGKTEESAPSPASTMLAMKSGETANLTNIPRWIITPTSITRVGSTATATIPAGYVDWFGDKDRATIAGAAQAEYNGTFEITRLSDTQFTYQVTGAPATPATGTLTVKSNHNVTKKRVYRIVVGNSGAFYRFVTELNESDTTYSDTATDSTISLNNVIPTFDQATLRTWDMPPRDLHSIVDMGNGILAGLSGNVVCLSEPYFYHAWPKGYRRTLPFDGVGLGVIGTTLVVPTSGYPITYSGTHPATLAENRLDKVNQVCLSKRGIVSRGRAVEYPSKDGLVMIGAGSSGISTNAWFDRESWATVYPDTLRSFQFNDRYFGCYKSGIDSNGNSVGGAFIIDPDNEVGGLGSDNRYFSGGFYDVTVGSLYLVQGSTVYEWDADTANRDILNWKSGKKVLPAPVNMSCARVEATFQYTQAEVDAINTARAAAIAVNTAILGLETFNGSMNSGEMNDLELNGDDGFATVLDAADPPNLTFQVYSKDVLVFSKSLTATSTFRLNEGYKTDDIAVLVAGNGIVQRVQLAENMLALRRK